MIERGRVWDRYTVDGDSALLWCRVGHTILSLLYSAMRPCVACAGKDQSGWSVGMVQAAYAVRCADDCMLGSGEAPRLDQRGLEIQLAS
ncbi:hypothetical protein XarbCFBP7408_18110 [Xanthomonas arboricola pv. guizotiae]|uniref:Uncharacterized protein n=1 Tax=Xanthomonas arboricola pv. guizotiae TaxID=487867 RepID=A0A2S6ZUZ9_9XANT|nr:hypothetical protein XarbCFBP7409_15970 [Xanthomonas arboricola pv. guizotiae]PPU20088.1 hypothetical protein XarbCFBP7408_18110 [Xanthomonas arboricola pv. guizotiae]